MSPEPQLQFFTRADGGRIAYTVWGSGLPLLRLPGWLSHQGLFAQQAAERVFVQALSAPPAPWMEIAYDRQGTGLSSRERTDFSFEGMVQELDDLIDHLGLSQVALLCGSVAALAGIAYAARRPERVSKLILVNAAARGAGYNMALAHSRWLWSGGVEEALAQ